MLLGVAETAGFCLTFVETRLAIEVEEGRDGWAEDVGVEDSGFDTSSGEGKGEVDCWQVV